MRLEEPRRSDGGAAHTSHGDGDKCPMVPKHGHGNDNPRHPDGGQNSKHQARGHDLRVLGLHGALIVDHVNDLTGR